MAFLVQLQPWRSGWLLLRREAAVRQWRQRRHIPWRPVLWRGELRDPQQARTLRQRRRVALLQRRTAMQQAAAATAAAAWAGMPSGGADMLE